MNAHKLVLAMFDSPYQMSQETGIDYGKCKRWARNGYISDPAAWPVILNRSTAVDAKDWCYKLAKDYRSARDGD